MAYVGLCGSLLFFASCCTCLTLFPRLTLRCLWLEAARETLASVAWEGLLFFFLKQRKSFEIVIDFHYLGGRSGLGASESDVRRGMEVAGWDPWVNHNW